MAAIVLSQSSLQHSVSPFFISVLSCVVIFYIYIPYCKYTLFSFKRVFMYKVFRNSGLFILLFDYCYPFLVKCFKCLALGELLISTASLKYTLY